MAYLKWGAVANEDAPQAIQTRHGIVSHFADTPTLVIGTHFATSAAGHIMRDGDAYRLDM